MQKLRTEVRGPHRSPCPTAEAGSLTGDSGFTLIEMMIVVTIIAFIAGLVGLNLIKRFDEARIDTTKTQIRQLELALDDFKRICGFYSDDTTMASMRSSSRRPAANARTGRKFIKGGKLPKDAWGNDFRLLLRRRRTPRSSPGADGEGRRRWDSIRISHSR